MFKKKLRPEGPSARKGRRESVRCVRSYTLLHHLPQTKNLSGNSCTESLGRLFSTYFLFLVFILFVFYASILKIGNGRYDFAGVEVGLPSDAVGLKSVLKTKYTMANSNNEQTNEIVIQYVLTTAAFPKLINA